jgi:hypothetical protein
MNTYSQDLLNQAIAQSYQAAANRRQNQVQTPNRDVQVTPSPTASSNLFTALPHMIGRMLGANQMKTVKDPLTGQTYQVPIHPTLDGALNEGKANDAGYQSNLQQQVRYQNDVLNRGDAVAGQTLDNTTVPAADVRSLYQVNPTPTTGAIAQSGILSNNTVKNQLNASNLWGSVLGDDDYKKAVLTGNITGAQNAGDAPATIFPVGSSGIAQVGGNIVTGKGANPNPIQSSTTTIIPPNTFTRTSGSTHTQSNTVPGPDGSVSINVSPEIQALRAQQATTPQATGNEPAINGGAPVVNPTPTPVPVTSFPGLGMPQAPDNSLQSLTGQPAPTVNPTPTPGMMPDGSDPREISNVLSRLLSHIIGTNVSQ